MGLWIRCRNKNAVFTMGWKKFVEAEKASTHPNGNQLIKE
jgi:hypothetical protein